MGGVLEAKERKSKGVIDGSNLADCSRRRRAEEEPLDFVTGRSWTEFLSLTIGKAGWPIHPLAAIPGVKPVSDPTLRGIGQEPSL